MNRNANLSANLVSICGRRFSPGRRSFLGPGSEKKWYSIYDSRPQGEWDRVAELMMIKFSESGHPVFRATSPLSRGTLKTKGGGKLSTHFCADEGTIETFFRTIISVNQLSIYGAVAKNYPKIQGNEPAAKKDLESMEIPTELPNADPHTNAELQGNVLQDHEHKFEQLPEDQTYPDCAAMQVWEMVQGPLNQRLDFVEGKQQI